MEHIKCKTCGTTMPWVHKDTQTCDCGALTILQDADGPVLVGDPDLADDVPPEFLQVTPETKQVIRGYCTCGKEFFMKQFSIGGKEFALASDTLVTVHCPKCHAVTTHKAEAVTVRPAIPKASDSEY